MGDFKLALTPENTSAVEKAIEDIGMEEDIDVNLAQLILASLVREVLSEPEDKQMWASKIGEVLERLAAAECRMGLAPRHFSDEDLVLKCNIVEEVKAILEGEERGEVYDRSEDPWLAGVIVSYIERDLFGIEYYSD